MPHHNKENVLKFTLTAWVILCTPNPLTCPLCKLTETCRQGQSYYLKVTFLKAELWYMQIQKTETFNKVVVHIIFILEKDSKLV